MNLALLFPLGLAALAAWLLPLLLHLARREQQQPTPFAALRWLAAKVKPRQRLQLEEWPLLLLRLLLLAVLALLLARPVWTGGDAGAWVVVHPALTAPPALAGDATQHAVWLAPGFPPLDSPRPALPVATASLLRQLDAELPAASTLTVHVPSWFDGADGERPRLSHAIDWQVAEVAAPADSVAASSPSPAPAPASPPPRLAVRHDAAHAPAARWLRAVAVAWAMTPVPDVADTAAALPGHDTVVAWLAGGDIPAALRQWIDAGGTALLGDDTNWPLAQEGAALWRDDDGSVLASAATLGHGRVLRLHRPLQPEAMPALLDGAFPARLRTLLQAATAAPARAAAAAQAPLTGGAGFAAIPQSADLPLIALVLLLFALERWFATARRAEAGA